jgi:hypothetical protein
VSRPSFKPNPHPERAVILTKKSVAKSQLQTAIFLWFGNADPAPILVLAYNAHEILHALGKNVGKPSQLKAWLATMPKRFQAQWKYVWNFCKHGLKDIDDDVLYDPHHAEILIYFAVECYREVTGKLSPLLFAFGLRFLVENPKFINWPAALAAIPVTEFSETYREASCQSRQEFLATYLPLIESGRFPVHSTGPLEST